MYVLLGIHPLVIDKENSFKWLSVSHRDDGSQANFVRPSYPSSKGSLSHLLISWTDQYSGVESGKL